jgi:hypothetical protein
LQLREVAVWPDLRLGASFGYRGQDVEATTYLYNLGLENILCDVFFQTPPEQIPPLNRQPPSPRKRQSKIFAIRLTVS